LLVNLTKHVRYTENLVRFKVFSLRGRSPKSRGFRVSRVEGCAATWKIPYFYCALFEVNYRQRIVGFFQRALDRGKAMSVFASENFRCEEKAEAKAWSSSLCFQGHECPCSLRKRNNNTTKICGSHPSHKSVARVGTWHRRSNVSRALPSSR
jgi:hypothetical protein